MDSDNNLRFKSILSKWTDFCRLWDKGGGWWVTCIEDGGGEGICPESQRGICAIVQYYPAHVTKWERAGQREPLVSRGTDEKYEKRKQDMGRRKHEMAIGCKQMTRCDRQAKQVTKITVNTQELQMLHGLHYSRERKQAGMEWRESQNKVLGSQETTPRDFKLYLPH